LEYLLQSLTGGTPIAITPEQALKFSFRGGGLRLARRFWWSKLDMSIGRNSVHKMDSICSAAMYCAIMNDSAEGAYTDLRILLPEHRAVSADRLLARFKDLSIEQMLAVFDKATERMAEMAKKRNLFSGPAVLAIDYHEIPYYGDINNPYVVGTKRKAGTNYAFRFATAEVVEPGKRFTLAALPVRFDERKHEVVGRLVKRAKRYAKIRHICLDRGFYGVLCINKLKALGMKFIMPIIRNNREKALIKEHLFRMPVVLPYAMGSGKLQATFNICIMKDENGDPLGFATNYLVDKDQINWIKEEYRARWGIETGYRVKKEFRARTTSRSIVVRALYFLLSVLLYNIWTLLNAELPPAVHVRTKTFRLLVYSQLGSYSFGRPPP
jgi:hypothetical protein